MSDYIEAMDILSKHKTSSVHTYKNAKCLRCDIIEEDMIRVGVLIFCFECFDTLFQTQDPVIEERETYLYWLVIHKNKYI